MSIILKSCGTPKSFCGFTCHLRILAGLLFICLTLGFSLPANAASQVTHARVAEKYLEKREPRLTEEQKHAFMLGTLFPDIRYIAQIPRTKTHMRNVTLDMIQKEKRAFMKGMKFHSWMDENRSKIIKNSNIYAKLKNVPGTMRQKKLFLKLLEDEVLFSQKDWSPMVSYFGNVSMEEEHFGIPSSTVNNWHRVLKASFKSPPSENLQFLLNMRVSFLRIPNETLRAWTDILPQMARDKQVRQHVTNLMKEFDHLLAKQEQQVTQKQHFTQKSQKTREHQKKINHA